MKKTHKRHFAILSTTWTLLVNGDQFFGEHFLRIYITKVKEHARRRHPRHHARKRGRRKEHARRRHYVLKDKKKEHARRQHPAIIFINFKTVETGNACSYFSKCLYAKLRTFITQRGMNRCQDDQCDEADFLYAKLGPFGTPRGYVRCLR